MSKTLSLKQMFEVWRQVADKMPVKIDIHPSEHIIQGLADGSHMDNREKWFKHLADCPKCSEIWLSIVCREEKNEISLPDEYLDTLLPKVAGTDEKSEDNVVIISTSGKFKVTLFKNLENKVPRLLTLNIIDESIDYENKRFVLRDKNNKRLLEGKLTQRELSVWIDEPDDIDLSFCSLMIG